MELGYDNPRGGQVNTLTLTLSTGCLKDSEHESYGYRGTRILTINCTLKTKVLLQINIKNDVLIIVPVRNPKLMVTLEPLCEAFRLDILSICIQI